MRLDVYHHDVPAAEILAALERKLDLILTNQETIMSALDDLTTQVSSNTTVIQSALTLINGIADRIKAAGTDSAALDALTASLKADDNALAAAVSANTPTAP